MKTIKTLILVFFLFGIIGCKNNPINPVEIDLKQMSFSIKTFEKVDSYLITKLTYDIHSAKKFITWDKEGLIEIYLQSQVKYLEVNGCSSILIGSDTYEIDKFIYEIHDGNKFILYSDGEVIEIYLQEQVKYLEVE